VATSAQTITPVCIFKFIGGKNEILITIVLIKEILRKLYHFNHRAENWDLNKPKAVPSRPDAPSESQSKNIPASAATILPNQNPYTFGEDP
jgi:hypothetical protein